MPLMTPEQAREINAGARFLDFFPATVAGENDDMPCVEIGGVQVYVYVDPERGLRIAVHFDTAKEPLLSEHECVPLEIDLTGGEPVYRADARGRDTYPALADDAAQVVRAAEQLGRAGAWSYRGGDTSGVAEELRAQALSLAGRIQRH